MTHITTRGPSSAMGALLCLVALLAANAAPAQTPAPDFDHFKCFAVRDSLRLKTVVDLAALRADLGIEDGCRISRAKFLCTPVKKTVVASNVPVLVVGGEPLPGDMLCYNVRCPRTTPPPDQDVVDQFGLHELRLRDSKLLCTPVGNVICTPTGPEVCDGVDNNCNGVIDELAQITCGTGACERTVESCVDGISQTCTPATPGLSEDCNGIDDDCDGEVDEGIRDLTCGYGQCQIKQPFCVNGELRACCTPAMAIDPGVGPGPDGQLYPCGDPIPMHLATLEICDGVDNDCDSFVDEDDPDFDNTPVTCGVGKCENTITSQCVDGVPQTCQPGPADLERCDNTLDDNCNNLIDEPGCVCSAGDAGNTDCIQQGDGCEADLLTNVDNCGACGFTCAPAEICDAGSCRCETDDLQTDENNCGVCGNVCAVGETCCGGTCRDLQTDGNNCGSCGLMCAAGETCCFGSCSDLTDDNNCGACGNTCNTIPFGACCGGTCSDLETDDDNCGACGTTCDVGKTCVGMICG